MSLERDFAEYYAARAPVHDERAGYLEEEAEILREPIKERYRRMFAGHDVLEIACGTGYWTDVVAETARSVLATDLHPAMVDQARARCGGRGNVSYAVADAYALEGLPGTFTAAFAVYWWSHVPLGRRRGFLEGLHGRLRPGALVHLVDELPYDRYETWSDEDGNHIEKRSLPDGRTFEVVKNFPSGEEMRKVLTGLADALEFVERPNENTWSVTYRARAHERT